jgi:hypothetical protein
MVTDGFAPIVIAEPITRSGQSTPKVTVPPAFTAALKVANEQVVSVVSADATATPATDTPTKERPATAATPRRPSRTRPIPRLG